jgi:ketosteroid isomerase-like protein
MKFSANASLILLAAILLTACAAKTSDEQQVRALVDEVESATEARDASDVLEHVAADYSDSRGLDKTQLQNFLRGYFLAHPRVELLVDIESLEFPVDGLAQAVITVTTVELTDPGRQRLKVEFRRSDDGWRVTRADRVES